jgi:hypothetical protein
VSFIIRVKSGTNYERIFNPSSAGSVLSKFRFTRNTSENTTTQCRSLHLVNIIVLLVEPSESEKCSILQQWYV